MSQKFVGLLLATYAMWASLLTEVEVGWFAAEHSPPPPAPGLLPSPGCPGTRRAGRRRPLEG